MNFLVRPRWRPESVQPEAGAALAPAEQAGGRRARADPKVWAPSQGRECKCGARSNLHKKCLRRWPLEPKARRRIELRGRDRRQVSERPRPARDAEERERA